MLKLRESNLKHRSILIFDFETSGLSPLNSQVIEVGAIKLVKGTDGYVIEHELNHLVQCPTPLPEKIKEITNISDEMLLSEGITEHEAFLKLYELIDEDTLLIAYNIGFDLGFLDALFKKYIQKYYQITHDILDVMAVYKDRQKFPHRLESAVKTYGVMVPNTHRALDDCHATLESLDKMQLEKNNIERYVNVIGYNKKYGAPRLKLPHVRYIAQYGGFREIERLT